MRRLFAICVFMFAPGAAWAADSADQQARALFASDWQWRLQNQPEFATAMGDARWVADDPNAGQDTVGLPRTHPA